MINKCKNIIICVFSTNKQIKLMQSAKAIACVIESDIHNEIVWKELTMFQKVFLLTNMVVICLKETLKIYFTLMTRIQQPMKCVII